MIMDEPIITIGGVELTPGQSAVVRGAIENMAAAIVDPDSLGSDELGRSVRAGYMARIHEIRALLYRRT